MGSQYILICINVYMHRTKSTDEVDDETAVGASAGGMMKGSFSVWWEGEIG